jgi:hypothetical protein
MMGELPKLFGKNFVIGYFLPSSALATTTWGILAAFEYMNRLTAWLKHDLLIGASLFLFLVWIGAIVLMGLNGVLLGVLQGYGTFNPAKLMQRRYERLFRDIIPVLKSQAEVDEARAKQHVDPEVPADHAGNMQRAVRDFPDKLEFVLPTRAGNKIRASQVYSRVVYGLDAIPAWTRLQAVIPATYQALIDDAKAQLDFFVNIMYGAALSLVLYVALAVGNNALPAWWIIFVCTYTIFVSYSCIVNAAEHWGEYVKSAFDLYRGELARQLGLELPRSIQAERVMWQTLSRMMIYRSSARCDELMRFKAFEKK